MCIRDSSSSLGRSISVKTSDHILLTSSVSSICMKTNKRTTVGWDYVLEKTWQCKRQLILSLTSKDPSSPSTSNQEKDLHPPYPPRPYPPYPPPPPYPPIPYPPYPPPPSKEKEWREWCVSLLTSREHSRPMQLNEASFVIESSETLTSISWIVATVSTICKWFDNNKVIHNNVNVPWDRDPRQRANPQIRQEASFVIESSETLTSISRIVATVSTICKWFDNNKVIHNNVNVPWDRDPRQRANPQIRQEASTPWYYQLILTSSVSTICEWYATKCAAAERPVSSWSVK